MPDNVSGRVLRSNFSARPIHVGFKGNRRPLIWRAIDKLDIQHLMYAPGLVSVF